MTPALVVEPAAEEDILIGYRWYEDRLVGLGSEFLEALDFTFSKVLEHPLLYTEVIPGIRRSVTRTFPYLVFYVYEIDTVHILAVIHAAQNPSYITARLNA
ncbi:MAG TPA: type II toxin-antitoxin system RelE/ParE family toxin [Bacteroidetes bacterium]|nr:type II toxin-antitoxin system RelE/ParE family toxin [Bacteroidota bacterium]HEX05593.1 type II toxin-antitoxin system RelE/ParE family toxin [Bacteroidota bacterium]